MLGFIWTSVAAILGIALIDIIIMGFCCLAIYAFYKIRDVIYDDFNETIFGKNPEENRKSYRR